MITEDLEDFYAHAPCGFLSLDTKGVIANANATFASWLGFTAEELAGKRFRDLLNVGGAIFFETHFVPLLRLQGACNEVAFDLKTAAGAALPVLVNAAERRDAAGKHLLTRVTVFNATERRQFERELIAARKTIESLHAVAEANLHAERETAALREQFIAVLGHDLRNPLAAISSGVSLLSRMQLNERGQMIAGHMHDSVRRMTVLIENVMDFARGRLGGGLTLQLEENVDVPAVLGQIITELRDSHPEREIATVFDLVAPVSFDPQRVGQLFSNLLGNALTHGTPGEPVRVTITAGAETFVLAVTNASPPIPEAALERLFQPFFRGAVRPSQQGLGLGLYIASQIASAHGGTLDVTSGETETCFTFRIPLAPLAAT